jgi:hypothetical protein
MATIRNNPDNTKFTLAANFIVEEHIRIHDKMVPHPDRIKEAIARELRSTWDEAIAQAASAIESLRKRD